MAVPKAWEYQLVISQYMKFSGVSFRRGQLCANLLPTNCGISELLTIIKVGLNGHLDGRLHNINEVAIWEVSLEKDKIKYMNGPFQDHSDYTATAN